MDWVSSSGIVVVVVVVAVTMVLLGIKRARNVACPRCGTQPPAFRRPTSTRQMLWGGWTCSNCGAELDRRGALTPTPPAK
jgi:DNA-directed RNA polymerase subunit RPC12/RpoP